MFFLHIVSVVVFVRPLATETVHSSAARSLFRREPFDFLMKRVKKNKKPTWSWNIRGSGSSTSEEYALVLFFLSSFYHSAFLYCKLSVQSRHLAEEAQVYVCQSRVPFAPFTCTTKKKQQKKRLKTVERSPRIVLNAVYRGSFEQTGAFHHREMNCTKYLCNYNWF